MKLWLCVDPGETTGWSLWDKKGKLVYADQTPMWNFIDLVYETVARQENDNDFRSSVTWGDVEVEDIIAIICEDWQLYPWELQNLAWDKCRTARAIGALTLICRQFNKTLVFQGADIKKGAQAAGAEALYLEPVHENRHANDSIQHGVFYQAVKGGPPE